jgi:hypothetical protein
VFCLGFERNGCIAQGGYRSTRVTLNQKEVRQKRSIREKKQAEECFADNCEQP